MLLFPIGIFAQSAGSGGSGGTPWDPSKKASGISLSTVLQSNDKASYGSGGAVVLGVSGKNTGKFYWETIITLATGANAGIGQAGTQADAYGGASANSVGVSSSAGSGTAGFVRSGAFSGTSPGFANGDNVSFALDIDNGLLWARKNGGGWCGTTNGGGNPVTGFQAFGVATGVTWYPLGTCYASGDAVQLKTASSDWSYAAPSGYGQWS